MPGFPSDLRDVLTQALTSAVALVWTLGFFFVVHGALLKLVY